MLALLLGCLKLLPPTLVPAETPTYTTDDGCTNQLRHYPADGAPVLLVHGMGANHYNYDFREEVSLAAYLQAEGWDVWVVGLRGDPGSEPAEKRQEKVYTFDEFAAHDLPAAVDRVLELTGEEQVGWVGHSMGGMLLYAYLRQHPDRVAAGVAVSSPVQFGEQPPLHGVVRHTGWTVPGQGRVRQDVAAKAFAPLAYNNPIIRKLTWRPNMDPAVTRGLAKVAIEDMPHAFTRQVLTWLDGRAFVDGDGRSWVEPHRGTPLMVMGGDKDLVAPWDNVHPACAVYSPCELVHLSPDGGFDRHYGHLDPMLGVTAERDVYPLIGDFLERTVSVQGVADQ